MGRHTKFLDQPDWEEPASEAEAPPAPAPAKPTRLAWLGRTPLMPLLAGVVAVGVIAAAFSTRQISLNFAGSAPAGPGSAACAGCESLSDRQDAQGSQDGVLDQQVPAQASVPSQSARNASRQPLEVDIRLVEMVSGGFVAVAVVHNTTKAAKNWRLAFRIPNAVVVGVEGASLKRTKAHGGTTWFTGLTALAARQSVKVRFTANGAWSKPAVCKVNGRPCG